MANTRIAEVRLNSHLMTSRSRMYPTKAGVWTRNKMEDKDWAAWKLEFNAVNVESRNRVAMSLREAAHVLLLALPIMKEGVEQGVYGPVILTLVQQVDLHKEALAQVDGASGVPKTAASVQAAATELCDWFELLSTKRMLKAVLPKLHFSSEVLRHVTLQLGEWISALEDPVAYAAAITRPLDQEAPGCARFVRCTAGNGKRRLAEYLGSAMAPAGQAAAVVAPVLAGAGGFANFMEDDAAAPVAAPAPRGRRRAAAAAVPIEEEDDDADAVAAPAVAAPGRRVRRRAVAAAGLMEDDA
jgi:hypothetical protein